jgi:hypothetical protein
MPRIRPPRQKRQSPEVETLTQLARSLAQSCSHIEDSFWEARLATTIDKLISSSDDESLNMALDSLNQADPRACDALADMIEFRCESRIENAHKDLDVLLFAAPLLAWSRYAIPSGPIAEDTMKNLRVQFAAHVFSADVRLGLIDVLLSPDQLPEGYSDISRMKDKLVKSALHGRDLHLDPKHLGETVSFLSDTRYLVGVAVVAKGTALFRWQEADGNRDTVLASWRSQGGEALRPLLPACASELLLPLAFHAACREADRQSRAYSIRASVAFLNTTVNIAASQLTAIIAPFQESRTEEYRIGFVSKESSDVVHGVVWPMLDAEDDNETPAQIEAVLRDCGITDIRLIEHVFPLEYCDDCGTPLYPNTDDEAVHAELPESDGIQAPQHLH